MSTRSARRSPSPAHEAAMRRVKARSVKVKWATDMSPTVDELRNTFQAWGPISTIKVREETALILYREVASVATALENYRGAWAVRGTGESSSSRSSTPNPTPTRLDRSQRWQDEYDRAEERRQRGRTRERGTIRGSSTQSSAGHHRDRWRQSAGDQATSRSTLQQPSMFFDEAAPAVSGGPVRAVRISTMMPVIRSAPFVARPGEQVESSKVETQHGARDSDALGDPDSTHEASYVVVEAPRHEKHDVPVSLSSSVPRYASKSLGGTPDIALPQVESGLGDGKPPMPGPNMEDEPAQPEPPLRLETKENAHAVKPPSIVATGEENVNFLSVAPPKSDVVYFQLQKSAEAPLSARPGPPGGFPMNSSILAREEAPRSKAAEAALSARLEPSGSHANVDLPTSLTGFADAPAKIIGQPASTMTLVDAPTPALMVNDAVPASALLSTEAGYNCIAPSGTNDGDLCHANSTLPPAAGFNDLSYGSLSKSPASAASTLPARLPATSRNVDVLEPSALFQVSPSPNAAQPAVNTQNLILSPRPDPPASVQSPPDSCVISTREIRSAVNPDGAPAYSASSVSLPGPHYDSKFASPPSAYVDPPLRDATYTHEADTSLSAFDAAQPGVSYNQRPSSGEFAPESSLVHDTSQLFQDADSHSAFDLRASIPSSYKGLASTTPTQFESPTEAPELAALEHGNEHMSGVKPHTAEAVPSVMVLEDGPDPVAFTNAPSASSVPGAGGGPIGEGCLPSANFLQDGPSCDKFPSAPTYLALPTDTFSTRQVHLATREQAADLPHATIESHNPETEFGPTFTTFAATTDSPSSSLPQDDSHQLVSEEGPPLSVDSPRLSSLPSNLFTDMPRATTDLHDDNFDSTTQVGSTARRRDAEPARNTFGDVQAEMTFDNGVTSAGHTQSPTSNPAHNTSHFSREIHFVSVPGPQRLCGSQSEEVAAFSPAQYNRREPDLSHSPSETKDRQDVNFVNASPGTSCVSESIVSSLHHEGSQLFNEAGAPSAFDQPPLVTPRNEIFEAPTPQQLRQLHPPAGAAMSRGNFGSGNYGAVIEQPRTEFEFTSAHTDPTSTFQGVGSLPSLNFWQNESKETSFDKAPPMHTPSSNDQSSAGPVVSECNHPPFEQKFTPPFPPPIQIANLEPSDHELPPASNGFSKNRPPNLASSAASQSMQQSQLHLSTAFGTGSFPNEHVTGSSSKIGSPTAFPKGPHSLAAGAGRQYTRPPHACIAFGFGGRVAAVRRVDVPFFSTTSTYQQQHVLEHQVVISRLPGKADLLVKPNALLSTETSYVDGPAECAAPFPCLSSLLALISTPKRRGDARLHGVRDFVEAAFKHSEYRRNATVVNTTTHIGLDEARVVFWAQIRRLLDLKDKDGACAFLQDAHVNTRGVDDEAFPLFATRTRTRSIETLNAKKVEDLLRDGDVQGAVSAAVKYELWPVAMILASTLDDAGATFRTIANQFMNDFVDPGSVLYARLRLSKAGDQEILTKKKDLLYAEGFSSGANKPLAPSVQQQDQHGLEDRWCYVLAYALEQASESVRTSLALDLGDRLLAASSDRMALAAHVAYIAAGVPHFSSLESRVGLLGLVTSQKRPSVSAIAAALRRTEILDVARKRRGLDVARYPETNPAYYRMLHANLLADVGALDEAHEYCEYAKSYLTKPQGFQGKRNATKAQAKHVSNGAVTGDMDKKALAMFEDFQDRLQRHGLKIGMASASPSLSSNTQNAASSLMGKFVGAIGETISETISQMTKEEETSAPLSSIPPPVGSTGTSPQDSASAIGGVSQSLTHEESALKNANAYSDVYKAGVPVKAAPSYPQFPAYSATATANRHAVDKGNAVHSTLQTVPANSEGQNTSDCLSGGDFVKETQGHPQASNLSSTGIHASLPAKPPHQQKQSSLDQSYEYFAKNTQNEGHRDQFFPSRHDENSQGSMEREDGKIRYSDAFSVQQLASDQSETFTRTVAISSTLPSPELHRISPKPSDGPKNPHEELSTPPLHGVSTPQKEKSKPPRPPSSAPSGLKGPLDTKSSGTGRTGNANLEAKQSRMSRIISRLFYPGAKAVDWDEQNNKEQGFYFDKEREQYVFPNADGQVADNPADKPPPTSLPQMNVSGSSDGGLHHSRSSPQMSNSNTANTGSSAESDPLAALVAPPPARIPKSSSMTRSKSEGEKLSGATGPPRYATFAPPPS